jgi:hypothetical protein
MLRVAVNVAHLVFPHVHPDATPARAHVARRGPDFELLVLRAGTVFHAGILRTLQVDVKPKQYP